MRREVTRQRSRSPALGPTPKAQTAAGSSGCPSDKDGLQDGLYHAMWPSVLVGIGMDHNICIQPENP
ncbi:Rab11 Family-Interacting Protein 4 [Manis pentadactyla]|nr:Rab11 Family-Interacting Protein 4 [Manis pentadactyla]